MRALAITLHSLVYEGGVWGTQALVWRALVITLHSLVYEGGGYGARKP